MQQDIVSIVSGDFEVIASSSVFLLADRSTIFTIGIQDALILEFVFQEDNTDKPRLESTVVDQKRAKITFYNFKSVLPAGSVEPIEIGKFQGKKLLLNFSISTHSEKTSRLFQYTLYVKPNV